MNGMRKRKGKPGIKPVEALVPLERVQQRIMLLRGQKVIIDRDLATLYGTTTKALNQAVKRNKERFPEDFMFRLTGAEKREVVTICDHLRPLKFSRTLPNVRGHDNRTHKSHG